MMKTAELTEGIDPRTDVTGDDARLTSELSEILKAPPRRARPKRNAIVRNAVRVKAVQPEMSENNAVDDEAADEPMAATADLAARKSLQWVKRAQRQQQVSWLKEAGSWVMAASIGSALVASAVFLLIGAPSELVALVTSIFKI